MTHRQTAAIPLGSGVPLIASDDDGLQLRNLTDYASRNVAMKVQIH